LIKGQDTNILCQYLVTILNIPPQKLKNENSLLVTNRYYQRMTTHVRDFLYNDGFSVKLIHSQIMLDKYKMSSIAMVSQQKGSIAHKAQKQVSK